MVDFRLIKGTGDFYFMRHGQSESNREGVMQGRSASPLTEKGRLQARAAGEWFTHRRIDAILTSPLPRARETAEIVARSAGISSVEPVEELTEIDTGLFTSLSPAQAEERHPREWQTFLHESWEGVPTAEKIDSLYRRAEAAWGMLFRMSEEGKRSILSVTHSGFLQWIIKSTVGHRQWMPLFSASGNCHVSHLAVHNRTLANGATGLYAIWMMVNAPAGIDGFPARD